MASTYNFTITAANAYAGDTYTQSYYTFTVTSANATVGATYTNNGHTFTVLTTIAAGTTLNCTFTGAPTASGTLTKSGGTGDTTITFSAEVLHTPTFTVQQTELSGTALVASGTDAPSANGILTKATGFGASTITFSAASIPEQDILSFCSTDTGPGNPNLLEQAAYAANPQLLIGNQPGLANALLVNKVLRQASYMASTLAQYIANVSGVAIVDNATPSQVLAAMAKAFTPQNISASQLAQKSIGQSVGIGGYATTGRLNNGGPGSSYQVTGSGLIPNIITGVNVTLVTTGRPVWVGFVPLQGGNTFGSTITAPGINGIAFSKDGGVTIIAYIDATNTATQMSGFWCIDTPPAGTYTYQAYGVWTSGQLITLLNVGFVAYEIN